MISTSTVGAVATAGVRDKTQNVKIKSGLKYEPHNFLAMGHQIMLLGSLFVIGIRDGDDHHRHLRRSLQP